MSKKTKRTQILRIKMKTRHSPDQVPIPASASQKPRTPVPLEIVELLEQILLHLPMRDVLLAQRVCTRWRSVIIHSNRLQRALYFVPSPIPSGSCPPLVHNPLIASAFAAYFSFPTANYRKPYNTYVILKSTEKPWEDSVKRKDASWRRMLIAQPPAYNVLVLDQRVAPDYDDCFEERAKDTEGVKLGQLLRFQEKAG